MHLFKATTYFLLAFYTYAFSFEEDFLLINGQTGETILEFGQTINEQKSPCSTFKIALSLMGYDTKILQDNKTPIWNFQEGYDDYLEAWKEPIQPTSWMKYSCVWYSEVLAEKLSSVTMQKYLDSFAFAYGNADLSADKKPVWIYSSLQISVKEQVAFLQKMITKKFSVSDHAVQMTKNILFQECLPQGWMLFGKTGWSGSVLDDLEIGWFVGWIEKGPLFFPFAYRIQEKKIRLDQRIPKVKTLLKISNILNIET